MLAKQVVVEGFSEYTLIPHLNKPPLLVPLVGVVVHIGFVSSQVDVEEKFCKVSDITKKVIEVINLRICDMEREMRSKKNKHKNRKSNKKKLYDSVNWTMEQFTRARR